MSSSLRQCALAVKCRIPDCGVLLAAAAASWPVLAPSLHCVSVLRISRALNWPQVLGETGGQIGIW